MSESPSSESPSQSSSKYSRSNYSKTYSSSESPASPFGSSESVESQQSYKYQSPTPAIPNQKTQEAMEEAENIARARKDRDLPEDSAKEQEKKTPRPFKKHW